MKSFNQEHSADTFMSTSEDVAMIPSSCATHLFNYGQHPANLPNTVKDAIESLHKLKMRTDEDMISIRCQELINLLFKKYPGVVACPE